MKRVLIVLAVILSACAPAIMEGQVEALQPATTVRGIEMALRGAPETVVLEKGQLQVMGWPQSGGWGFACIKCGDQTTLANALGKGNITTARTFSDLVRFLKNNGWTAVSPTVVTGAQAISVWIAQNVGGLTILILPIVPAEFVEQQS